MSTSATLVIGASEKLWRYSNKAIRKLKEHGHRVVAIGKRNAEVEEIRIETVMRSFSAIDTVTIYLNKHNQKTYYDYILNLNPRRVIFNPGTENPEFYTLLRSAGIEVLEACTLVLLSTNQY